MISEIYPPIVQVTDSGKVIGPINYELAHAKNGEGKGIRHQVSNIFIFEDSLYKKILLTRRSKNIDGAGKLNVCVGGHAIWLTKERRAQTPLETALLELNEEVFYNAKLPKGLTLRELTEFKKDIRPTDPEYVYIYETIYNGPFCINTDEVSEYFFREIMEVQEDIQTHPEQYIKSGSFYLKELLIHHIN